MNYVFIVLGLILVAVAIGFLVWKKLEEVKEVSTGLCIMGTAVGIILFVFGCSFTIVPTGNAGVKVVLGQVKSETVSPGFVWVTPFVEHVKIMNTKQQDINLSGQIWSETSERTVLYYEDITITYAIQAERAAWIYSNVSNYESSLITAPIISSAIKTVSKGLNSVDATNRGIIEPLIMKELQASLDGKFGEGTIVIIRFPYRIPTLSKPTMTLLRRNRMRSLHMKLRRFRIRLQ